MSTPTINKFVVWAPDMTDPEAFQRRLAVRTQHLQRANSLHDAGVIRVGGAILTPESVSSPTAEKKMIGSVVICEAESIDAVRKAMEEDIYYTSGVWDKEKLQIFPYATNHL